MARDYAKEYARYHSKPAQIKRRAARNKSRRVAVKKYGKAKLRGKDVNHTNTRTLKGRVTIETKARNRGFRRSSTGKNLGLPRKKRK
jgi:hypothetical protein